MGDQLEYGRKAKRPHLPGLADELADLSLSSRWTTCARCAAGGTTLARERALEAELEEKAAIAQARPRSRPVSCRRRSAASVDAESWPAGTAAPSSAVERFDGATLLLPHEKRRAAQSYEGRAARDA